MSSINTELLLRVYDKVAAQPERWDQDDWAHRTSCHTTYCIAGWACVLSGQPLYFGSGPFVSVTEAGEYIEPAAKRLLGLSDLQAYRLFHTLPTSLPAFAEAILAWTGVDVDDRVVSVTP